MKTLIWMWMWVCLTLAAATVFGWRAAGIVAALGITLGGWPWISLE